MTDDEREALMTRLDRHLQNLGIWDRRTLMVVQDAIIALREDGERIKALEAGLRNIAKAEGSDDPRQR